MPTPNMTRKPRKTRIKTNQLQDPKIAKRFQEEIRQGLNTLNLDEIDVDTLYAHMKNTLLTAGEKILGVTANRIKPRFTNELYGMLQRARNARKLMLETPRGPDKEILRGKMYEEYHTFYSELRRFRRLTL